MNIGDTKNTAFYFSSWLFAHVAVRMVASLCPFLGTAVLGRSFLLPRQIIGLASFNQVHPWKITIKVIL